MARATGRINAVTGFKVERLDRATLETYAKQLGILAPDATDEDAERFPTLSRAVT